MKPFVFPGRSLIYSIAAGCLLTGCVPSADSGADFKPKLDAAYAVHAEMHYGDKQSAEMKLTRCGAADWDAEFTAPDTLAGVLLNFDGGAVTASYKGLAFTIPKTAMPAKAMLCIVTDVLDAVQAQESLNCTEQSDGSRTCTGDAEGGTYTLTFAPDGTLTAFEMPGQPLSVTFTEYTAGNLPAETSASESTATTAATSASASESVTGA